MPPSRKSAFAALIAFCALAGSCRPEKTTAVSPSAGDYARAAAPRSIEPRLTLATVWQPCQKTLPAGAIVDVARCKTQNTAAQSVSRTDGACKPTTMSATEAVETLRTRPQCTDIAVAALERSVRDLPLPSAWSDLSAAYYVRAQREDEPSDFLRALDAAQRALNRAPLLPEAQFNRALAQEALGLSREAMRSWDALRRADASPWAREANEHWQRLARASVLIAATQWSLNRGRLPGVVQDTEAVAKLIAPYPAAAQRYVEDELLPRWADAAVTNDVRGAQDQLGRSSSST